MELFPAIDLIDGCAVRLVKGDYAQKTIYSENPAAVALIYLCMVMLFQFFVTRLERRLHRSER